VPGGVTAGVTGRLTAPASAGRWFPRAAAASMRVCNIAAASIGGGIAAASIGGGWVIEAEEEAG